MSAIYNSAYIDHTGGRDISYGTSGDLRTKNRCREGIKSILDSCKDYTLTGVIIAVDHVDQVNALIKTNTSPPDWGIIYRLDSEGFLNTVTDMTYHINTNGVLSVVLEVDPIYSQGITYHTCKPMADVTLVKDGLGISSKVVVNVRSGELVVTEVLHPVHPTRKAHCPFCENILTLKKKQSICENKVCPGVLTETLHRDHQLRLPKSIIRELVQVGCLTVDDLTNEEYVNQLGKVSKLRHHAKVNVMHIT